MVMVKKKGGSNKKQKVKRSNLAFYGFGVAFIVIVAAIIIGFTDSPAKTTGASIYIKSYGVSDELISTQDGKLQTYIELKKPTPWSLTTLEGRSTVSKKITQKADFTSNLLQIYQNNPRVSPISSLDRITAGIKTENSNFENNEVCLKKIGNNWRNYPTLKLILISELKYQECAYKYNKVYAYVTHTFFKEDKFLCRQDNDKLFLIETDTGKIDTDTTEC
tara:strand:- start:2278 stop:2937 length:660 start_codon:yes stop_codon:yes gene_type:complete